MDTRLDAAFLTRAQVAEMLALSETSVIRLVAAGNIPPPIKVGKRLLRFDRQAVSEWLAAGCPKPDTVSK